MALFQADEHALHHRLADQRRARRDLETFAIRVDGRELLCVEQHGLAVDAPERGPLLVKVGGIDAGEFLATLLFPGQRAY